MSNNFCVNDMVKIPMYGKSGKVIESNITGHNDYMLVEIIEV